MKLYCSLTSPYARKIRVALLEWGLAERVEIVVVDPWSTSAALLASNPLSKVPSMETDDGVILMDSQLILDYLLAVSHRERVGHDTARWKAARRAQLADGIIDAAVSAVLESRRPAASQSSEWIARQLAAIERTLDVLEPESGEFAAEGEIGAAELTLGCALEYLDFRHAQLAWRTARPALASWIAAFSQRSSMRETAPPR